MEMGVFNYKKAVQALVFFCQKEESKKIDKIKALKLLFFAERFHLRKYNRMITNDSFWAMGMGPVASGTKDLIDSTNYGSDKGKDYAKRYIHKDAEHQLNCKNSFDPEVFSDSDIEALEFAWEKFGKYNYPEIIKITHKYPEWLKYSEKLKKEGTDRIPIEIYDFLEDPKTGVEICHNLSPEDKTALKEYLEERQSINNLWN